MINNYIKTNKTHIESALIGTKPVFVKVINGSTMRFVVNLNKTSQVKLESMFKNKLTEMTGKTQSLMVDWGDGEVTEIFEHVIDSKINNSGTGTVVTHNYTLPVGTNVTIDIVTETESLMPVALDNTNDGILVKQMGGCIIEFRERITEFNNKLRLSLEDVISLKDTTDKVLLQYFSGTDLACLFKEFLKLKSISNDILSVGCENVVSVSHMLYRTAITEFDPKLIETMTKLVNARGMVKATKISRLEYVFKNCKSTIKDVQWLVASCHNLVYVDPENFNGTRLNIAYAMFEYCDKYLNAEVDKVFKNNLTNDTMDIRRLYIGCPNLVLNEQSLIEFKNNKNLDEILDCSAQSQSFPYKTLVNDLEVTSMIKSFTYGGNKISDPDDSVYDTSNMYRERVSASMENNIISIVSSTDDNVPKYMGVKTEKVYRNKKYILSSKVIGGSANMSSVNAYGINSIVTYKRDRIYGHDKTVKCHTNNNFYMKIVGFPHLEDSTPSGQGVDLEYHLNEYRELDDSSVKLIGNSAINEMFKNRGLVIPRNLFDFTETTDVSYTNAFIGCSSLYNDKQIFKEFHHSNMHSGVSIIQSKIVATIKTTEPNQSVKFISALNKYSSFSPETDAQWNIDFGDSNTMTKTESNLNSLKTTNGVIEHTYVTPGTYTYTLNYNGVCPLTPIKYGNETYSIEDIDIELFPTEHSYTKYYGFEIFHAKHVNGSVFKYFYDKETNLNEWLEGFFKCFSTEVESVYPFMLDTIDEFLVTELNYLFNFDRRGMMGEQRDLPSVDPFNVLNGRHFKYIATNVTQVKEWFNCDGYEMVDLSNSNRKDVFKFFTNLKKLDKVFYGCDISNQPTQRAYREVLGDVQDFDFSNCPIEYIESYIGKTNLINWSLFVNERCNHIHRLHRHPIDSGLCYEDIEGKFIGFNNAVSPININEMFYGESIGIRNDFLRGIGINKTVTAMGAFKGSYKLEVTLEESTRGILGVSDGNINDDTGLTVIDSTDYIEHEFENTNKNDIEVVINPMTYDASRTNYDTVVLAYVDGHMVKTSLIRRGYVGQDIINIPNEDGRISKIHIISPYVNHNVRPTGVNIRNIRGSFGWKEWNNNNKPIYHFFPGILPQNIDETVFRNIRDVNDYISFSSLFSMYEEEIEVPNFTRYINTDSNDVINMSSLCAGSNVKSFNNALFDNVGLIVADHMFDGAKGEFNFIEYSIPFHRLFMEHLKSVKYMFANIGSLPSNEIFKTVDLLEEKDGYHNSFNNIESMESLFENSILEGPVIWFGSDVINSDLISISKMYKNAEVKEVVSKDLNYGAFPSTSSNLDASSVFHNLKLLKGSDENLYTGSISTSAYGPVDNLVFRKTTYEYNGKFAFNMKNKTLGRPRILKLSCDIEMDGLEGNDFIMLLNRKLKNGSYHLDLTDYNIYNKNKNEVWLSSSQTFTNEVHLKITNIDIRYGDDVLQLDRLNLRKVTNARNAFRNVNIYKGKDSKHWIDYRISNTHVDLSYALASNIVTDQDFNNEFLVEPFSDSSNTFNITNMFQGWKSHKDDTDLFKNIKYDYNDDLIDSWSTNHVADDMSMDDLQVIGISHDIDGSSTSLVSTDNDITPPIFNISGVTVEDERVHLKYNGIKLNGASSLSFETNNRGSSQYINSDYVDVHIIYSPVDIVNETHIISTTNGKVLTINIDPNKVVDDTINLELSTDTNLVPVLESGMFATEVYGEFKEEVVCPYFICNWDYFKRIKHFKNDIFKKVKLNKEFNLSNGLLETLSDDAFSNQQHWTGLEPLTNGCKQFKPSKNFLKLNTSYLYFHDTFSRSLLEPDSWRSMISGKKLKTVDWSMTGCKNITNVDDFFNNQSDIYNVRGVFCELKFQPGYVIKNTLIEPLISCTQFGRMFIHTRNIKDIEDNFFTPNLKLADADYEQMFNNTNIKNVRHTILADGLTLYNSANDNTKDMFLTCSTFSSRDKFESKFGPNTGIEYIPSNKIIYSSEDGEINPEFIYINEGTPSSECLDKIVLVKFDEIEVTKTVQELLDFKTTETYSTVEVYTLEPVILKSTGVKTIVGKLPMSKFDITKFTINEVYPSLKTLDPTYLNNLSEQTDLSHFFENTKSLDIVSENILNKCVRLQTVDYMFSNAFNSNIVYLNDYFSELNNIVSYVGTFKNTPINYIQRSTHFNTNNNVNFTDMFNGCGSLLEETLLHQYKEGVSVNVTGMLVGCKSLYPESELLKYCTHTGSSGVEWVRPIKISYRTSVPDERVSIRALLDETVTAGHEIMAKFAGSHRPKLIKSSTVDDLNGSCFDTVKSVGLHDAVIWCSGYGLGLTDVNMSEALDGYFTGNMKMEYLFKNYFPKVTTVSNTIFNWLDVAVFKNGFSRCMESSAIETLPASLFKYDRLTRAEVEKLTSSTFNFAFFLFKSGSLRHVDVDLFKDVVTPQVADLNMYAFFRGCSKYEACIDIRVDYLNNTKAQRIKIGDFYKEMYSVETINSKSLNVKAFDLGYTLCQNTHLTNIPSILRNSEGSSLKGCVTSMFYMAGACTRLKDPLDGEPLLDVELFQSGASPNLGRVFSDSFINKAINSKIINYREDMVFRIGDSLHGITSIYTEKEIFSNNVTSGNSGLTTLPRVETNYKFTSGNVALECVNNSGQETVAVLHKKNDGEAFITDMKNGDIINFSGDSEYVITYASVKEVEGVYLKPVKVSTTSKLIGISGELNINEPNRINSWVLDNKTIASEFGIDIISLSETVFNRISSWTSMESMCKGLYNLVDLAPRILDPLVNVTDWTSMFEDCDKINLTSKYTEFFIKANKGVKFDFMFKNDIGITEIANRFFMGCTQPDKTFNSTFEGCENLTAIPYDIDKFE